MLLIFFFSKIFYFSKLGDNCYEKGSTCEIMVEICRYFVLYKDKSSDLIDISDIDGVEMILMQGFYRHFNYFYCKYSFVYLDLSSFVFIFKKKKTVKLHKAL